MPKLQINLAPEDIAQIVISHVNVKFHIKAKVTDIALHDGALPFADTVIAMGEDRMQEDEFYTHLREINNDD